jgi:ligand-binding sensor domain-containing protein
MTTSGTYIFAGTNDIGVYRSSNNGANWVLTNSGLHTMNINALVVTGIYLFAGTNDSGVYRSTNNGARWDKVNNGITDLNIFDMTITGTNVFAASYGGGIYRSTNYGLSWTAVNTGLPSFNINHITSTSGNIYAAVSIIGIYRSTNNGSSWFQANNGITTTNIYDITTFNNNVFAATPDGIFVSTNYGTNWSERSEGLSNVKRFAISLIIANNYVFSGIYGQSVWRRSYPEIISSVKNITSELPTEFALEQNYPNPFNSMTIIKFQILNPGNTEIKIFDLLGREVATLVNGFLQPGAYEISFDGNGLNSGVYFYRMTTDGFSDTKKLVLLK